MHRGVMMMMMMMMIVDESVGNRARVFTHSMAKNSRTKIAKGRRHQNTKFARATSIALDSTVERFTYVGH